jgi:hypothetical protein
MHLTDLISSLDYVIDGDDAICGNVRLMGVSWKDGGFIRDPYPEYVVASLDPEPDDFRSFYLRVDRPDFYERLPNAIAELEKRLTWADQYPESFRAVAAQLKARCFTSTSAALDGVQITGDAIAPKSIKLSLAFTNSDNFFCLERELPANDPNLAESILAEIERMYERKLKIEQSSEHG